MPRHILFFLTFVFLSFSSYARDTQTDADTALGDFYRVQKKENLYRIAKTYDLGIDEILRANPQIKNRNTLYKGDELVLPIIHLPPDAEPDGIVINLAELRLYFYTDKGVKNFPISIGADEKTPIGRTRIIAKKRNPSWTPPESIRRENPRLPDVVPPGPNNPLGIYALYLDASENGKWRRIMIHGTNSSWTIGSKVTHGCIRLYPLDIKKLFDEVDIGTTLTIVNQPFKVLEIDKKVYFEVHLPHADSAGFKNIKANNFICERIRNCDKKINWRKVNQAIIQNLGIPFEVSI